MKFIFADSIDMVDPNYNFLEDKNGPGRKAYWDDEYPHEILGYAPYDGILVSRGIVGGNKVKGKYSEAQAMRFLRVGAREFLRLNKDEFRNLDIFGDCGAFTYVNEDVPPYKPAEMVAFYADGGFSHGCSVDHIIFDYDDTNIGSGGGSSEARRRYDITLENAAEFLRESKSLCNTFTPMGVVQGWSPGSMAEAAKSLIDMGYSYLAIGGMVPLKTPQIKRCLSEIREKIPASARIHILGFAKADDIGSFAPFRITSFDTTSPLIRAFKDAKQNYYLRSPKGGLDYYTALRIPQALENPRLQRLVKKGQFKAEELLAMEKNALRGLRAYNNGREKIAPVLEALMEYSAPLIMERKYSEVSGAPPLKSLEERYRRTLTEKPWKKCSCVICQSASVEVAIFRASNRNKRRGIHNLGVFNSLVDDLQAAEANHEEVGLFSN